MCCLESSEIEGERMKVAVAIWKDRISPVFDVSREILVLDVENNAIVTRTREMFENDHPIQKVLKMAALNIDTLICGAISNPLLELITFEGIETIPFTCGEITDVIQAFLKNALPDRKLSMPGCCGFRRRTRSRNPGAEKKNHIKGGAK
jgi:predicted Fe-Mo cluster-binding NifX family protein